MFDLYILLLAAHVSGAAATDATVAWVSQPLLPGEIGMVSGGGFSARSNITIHTSANTTFHVQALDASDAGLKFQLPSEASGAYDISVDDSGPFVVNMPEVWWWQGDLGNASSPGGWLRVFGRAIGAPHAQEQVRSGDVASLRNELSSCISRGEFKAAQESLLELEKATLALDSAPETRIRLLPVDGKMSPVLLTAVTANTTAWHALFELPTSLPVGAYKAEISNSLISPSHGEWQPLRMFVDPDEPALDTVTVRFPRVWKRDIFTVDCQADKPLFERPCGWVGQRSSKQLDAALETARRNGGGVVYLPRGQYYVDGPLIIPEGVTLRGESRELVSIVFREDDSPEQSPTPGYIHANNEASAWAVEDLTIYITSHFHSVFYVHPTCEDWTLRRVRVRAAAWAMLGDPVKGASGRNRVANFNREDVGEVIYLSGNTNYRIIDNDLLGTAIIIHTGGHGYNQGGAARWGHIARNTIWNANAAHWFDDIKQVIFEHNTVQPAGTQVSWGNNIDNYSNGFCQHVYHAFNVIRHVYAGDRESMTFDPINGAFFGPVTVDGTGLKLSLDMQRGNGSASSDFLGGMVSVLAGTGAGQYRRLIGVPDKSSVLIDQPFTTPLDGSSLVQVGPFKGRMIFHENRYEDGGAFQLYANAADIVVSSHRFARMEALLSWGRAANNAVYCPNIHIEFDGNIVEEGNHMWNWNGSYPYPHPKTVEPYSIGVLASDQDPQALPFQGAINHFVVIRNNEIWNNGGIVVRGHTTNVLVTGNAIQNSSIGIHVNQTHASHVYVVSNTVPKELRLSELVREELYM